MKLEDDYLHPIGPEINFNESMYFHFHAPAVGVGGFLRLANRPNEGRGERTVCLYLPGGEVAFGFARPTFQAADVMAAGGLAFAVQEPFERLGATYDGELSLLSDASRMDDPKTALSESPRVSTKIDLVYTAVAPAYQETFDGNGESFAPNHYEQLMAISGSLVIGDTRYPIEGHGIRDHSWGPRSWQAPWFYRWVHGSADGVGFMATYFGDNDGTSRQGGFVWDGATLQPVEDVEFCTTRDARAEQRVVRVRLRAGAKTWIFDGQVDSNVPLRNRRRHGDTDRVTRIVEGSTTWTTEDGRKLYGMTEYLDQLRGGLPVGLDV